MESSGVSLLISNLPACPTACLIYCPINHSANDLISRAQKIEWNSTTRECSMMDAKFIGSCGSVCVRASDAAMCRALRLALTRENERARESGNASEKRKIPVRASNFHLKSSRLTLSVPESGPKESTMLPFFRHSIECVYIRKSPSRALLI